MTPATAPDEGPLDVETAVQQFRAALAARGADQDPHLQEYLEVAIRSHHGQRRRSGGPYVTHPLIVATLAAQRGLPLRAVWFALLHDVVDSGTGRAWLTHDCPAELRTLVLALERLEVTDLRDAPDEQGRLVRQIKVLDRLHNARTWAHVPAPIRLVKAFQTLTAVAPLGESLDLVEEARELRELSVRALADHPASGVRAPAALHLVPAADRARYRYEWAAELASLSRRRDRAVFRCGLVWSGAVLRLAALADAVRARSHRAP